MFNLWDYVMERDVIIYMFYGCGEDVGNVLFWLVVREILNGIFNIYSFFICNECNGKL